ADTADGEPATALLALLGFEPVGPLSPPLTPSILQNRSSSFPYASQFGARCSERQLNQWPIAQDQLSSHQRIAQIPGAPRPTRLRPIGLASFTSARRTDQRCQHSKRSSSG